jgi:hypothetical protein
MVNINRPFCFCRLIGDIKALKLAGVILPIYIDLIDAGHPRSLPAPLENGINRLLLAFKNSFDRTVAFVPHPPENAKSFSGALCFHPKKHSLNPSGYDGMGPNLFFHVFLTNIWLQSDEAGRPMRCYQLCLRSSALPSRRALSPSGLSNQLFKRGFINYRDAQFLGLGELRARRFTGDNIICIAADGSADLTTGGLD